MHELLIVELLDHLILLMELIVVNHHIRLFVLVEEAEQLHLQVSRQPNQYNILGY